MKTQFQKAAFMTIVMICAAVFNLASVGTVKATNYFIASFDSYNNGQNVPYCQTNYDSIKCVPPNGVSGVYWAPALTTHGDTLVLQSGFNGAITCFYSGGQKYINLRPVSIPTTPTFTDDTICGIQTMSLNVGYNPQYCSFIWNTGATTPTITVGAGTYSVTVTNACGLVSHSAIINQYNPNAPDLGPDIVVCQGSSVTLNPGSGYNNLLWSPGGATTPTYSPTISGTYIVQVTNVIGGCVDMDTVNVTFLTPPTQDIDIVTIDTTSGNNKVTWDGLLYGSAAAAKIYRELTTDNYVEVGSNTYTTGTWTDTVNSRNQAWRYKISIIDTCGNEGPLSHYVQSIHTWVTPVIGGGYNVEWTPYLVEAKATPVSQYNIYKGAQLNQLQYLTFVSGSVTTYTMPAFVDSVYVVGAELAGKSIGDDALSNWVSQHDAVGIAESNQKLTFEIFPNPASDFINIQYEGMVYVECFNLMGEVVLSGNEKILNVSQLPAGSYTLKITAKGGYGYKKFVKF